MDSSAPALDELTGVALRRAFRQTASRTLEARHTTGRPVALLILDVDQLGVVNEQFGTGAGDLVLQHVAQAIRATVRPADFVGRYAGDEFVVLLSGVRFEEATRVAERIRATVAATSIALPPALTNVEQAVPIVVSVSLGVACAPQHGTTLDALFGAADNALYQAKHAGRNQVVPASRLQGGRQQLVLQTVVGRESERTRLREHFANASRGQPSVVLVTGEAGVGKSTLLKQLGPDLGVRGGAFLIGHCHRDGHGHALWAMVRHSARHAPQRPVAAAGMAVSRPSGSRTRHPCASNGRTGVCPRPARRTSRSACDWPRHSGR